MSASADLHTTLTMDRPTILLARANTASDSKRKKQVIKECDMIVSLFRRNADSPFQVISTHPETGIYLFDQLRQFRFKHSPVFLHIAGFADHSFLRLEGGWGEEALTPKQFARLLSRLPGLQMVFLNGCGTPALLEELLLMDIPAVFVTSETRSRKYSVEIAHAIYEALAKGETIEEAYQATQESHAHFFSYKRIFYQLEKDQLIWDGREKAFKRNELEWGLYALDDNQDLLKRDYFIPSEYSSSSTIQGQNPKKQSRRIVSALLAMGLMATMLFLLGQHPQIRQVWQAEEYECAFESPSAYHILQYPIWEAGKCELSDPYYQMAITRRLQQIEGAFEHEFLPDIPCNQSLSSAEKVLRSCQADLALWGTYHFVNPELVQLDFEYIYVGLPAVFNHGERSFTMPIHLFEEDNDFIYSAVEDIVFWTQGMGQVERGDYASAILSFEAMRETNEEGYYVVDMQLAKCFLYEKNYEKAREHLDHLLQLKPDHVASRYERGNIHLRQGNYQAAQTDLDYAISLQEDYADAYYSRGLLHLKTHDLEAALNDGTQLLHFRPEEARTHGLLAIIYAETENRSQAIEHLELGLQKGLETNSLFSSVPSLRQFEKDPEVQSLLSQYR